jgi:hypothetical protein
MAQQTDVFATKPLGAGAASFKDQANNDLGRVRIKSLHIECGASAGSVVITDGSGGSTLLTINTPSVANGGAYDVVIPDQGILAKTGLYGTITNTASVVVFYG